VRVEPIFGSFRVHHNFPLTGDSVRNPLSPTDGVGPVCQFFFSGKGNVRPLSFTMSSQELRDAPGLLIHRLPRDLRYEMQHTIYGVFYPSRQGNTHISTVYNMRKSDNLGWLKNWGCARSHELNLRCYPKKWIVAER